MIVNRLSRLLGERRLSIRDLVRGSGVSYSTAHDLFHARRTRIDLETLDRLCTFLGVDTQQILEWQPTPSDEADPSGKSTADNTRRSTR